MLSVTVLYTVGKKVLVWYHTLHSDVKQRVAETVLKKLFIPIAGEEMPGDPFDPGVCVFTMRIFRQPNLTPLSPRSLAEGSNVL